MNQAPKRRSVLLTIMAHDWRLLTRDKSWLAMGVLFAVFAAFGVYRGVSRVRVQQASIRSETRVFEDILARDKAALREYERRLLSNPEVKRPALSTIGIRGVRAMLPPGPLSALATGQSDVYPTSVNVVMYNHVHELFTQAEHENPLNLLTGSFDLAFLIVYLYPLFILATSYNVLSSERDEGVLALTLAQPVTLSQIVLAKAGLRALVVSGLAAACSLAAILWSRIATGLPGAGLPGAGMLSLLWLATILLYGAFWFVVAVAVNAIGKSSAANATLLATAWLFFVLLVPSFLHIAATYLYPAPTRMELLHAGRRASNQAEQEGENLVARYYREHPEFRAGEHSQAYTLPARIYYVAHAQVTRTMEPLMAKLNAQLDRQQELVNRCRFLSPTIIAQEALNDVAGTGVARFARFRSQAVALQSAWQDLFISNIFKGVRLTSADYDRIPRLDWREEAAGEVAARVITGLAQLTGVVLVLAVAAGMALRKYPVLTIR